MERLFGGLPMGGMGRGGAQQGLDAPMNDTAEHVYISSLALLKMLKHLFDRESNQKQYKQS